MISHYYKKVNPYYKPQPEIHPICENKIENNMQMIYPKNGSKLFLPRNLDGSKNQIVFKIAHTNPNAIVYWHLNGNYVGKTEKEHSRVIFTKTGHHKLTVVDDNGNEIKIKFEVVDINK